MTNLSDKEREALLETLQARFEENMTRHAGISWTEVTNRLAKNTSKLTVLQNMEDSGGEPDVIGTDPNTKEVIFADCAVESPSGRRSLAYDRTGLESRKEHRPENSAVDMARELGVELLDETWYRTLQSLGVFDAKTSSWIKTPDPIRKLGGALFGDYRYGTVFIYHNGAQSYYAARGFRGMIRI